MALKTRTKLYLGYALCADKKLLAELITKIENPPTVLSARLKKALAVMLPDPKRAYLEIVDAIQTGGPLTLSKRAKDLIKIAMDSRVEALDLIREIES